MRLINIFPLNNINLWYTSYTFSVPQFMTEHWRVTSSFLYWQYLPLYSWFRSFIIFCFVMLYLNNSDSNIPFSSCVQSVSLFLTFYCTEFTYIDSLVWLIYIITSAYRGWELRVINCLRNRSIINIKQALAWWQLRTHISN